MRVPPGIGALCASQTRHAHLVAVGVAIALARGERLDADLVGSVGISAARVARRGGSGFFARDNRSCGYPCLRMRWYGHQLPSSTIPVAQGVSLRPSSFSPLRLLGGHVRDLAVDDAGRGLLELERRRRQPEIRQLDLAGVYDTRTLGGRNVSVDEVEIGKRMSVRETAQQLLDDVDRDVDQERHLLLCAAVPHCAKDKALRQSKVHREEQFATDQAGVEHRDQVAVRQFHDNFRFIAESRRCTPRLPDAAARS